LDVSVQCCTPFGRMWRDMGVVMDISDRGVVLDHGKELADGTPAEVRGDQAVVDAYLGVARG